MFRQHADVIGLLLQTTGIIIISFSQARFMRTAKKKERSLKRFFLKLMYVPVMNTEKIEKGSNAELDESLKDNPFADWLYKDFKVSVIGLLFTVIGVVISLLGALQHYFTV